MERRDTLDGMHLVWWRDDTLAYDRHARDDRPPFCFLLGECARVEAPPLDPSTNNLTSLTGLEALEIETNDSAPLDSSGLVSLLKLTVHKSPITSFPTSLMVCELVVKTDLDLSSPTNPTSIRVELHSTVHGIPNATEGAGR